jgi:hypothetical protein
MQNEMRGAALTLIAIFALAVSVHAGQAGGAGPNGGWVDACGNPDYGWTGCTAPRFANDCCASTSFLGCQLGWTRYYAGDSYSNPSCAIRPNQCDWLPGGCLGTDCDALCAPNSVFGGPCCDLSTSGPCPIGESCQVDPVAGAACYQNAVCKPVTCNNDGDCDTGETNANCPGDCPVCVADEEPADATDTCCSPIFQYVPEAPACPGGKTGGCCANINQRYDACGSFVCEDQYCAGGSVTSGAGTTSIHLDYAGVNNNGFGTATVTYRVWPEYTGSGAQPLLSLTVDGGVISGPGTVVSNSGSWVNAQGPVPGCQFQSQSGPFNAGQTVNVYASTTSASSSGACTGGHAILSFEVDSPAGTTVQYLASAGASGGIISYTFYTQPACGPVCGNGVTEGTEQCDLGGSNGACPSTCSATCTNNACAAQCDDTTENQVPARDCSTLPGGINTAQSYCSNTNAAGAEQTPANPNDGYCCNPGTRYNPITQRCVVENTCDVGTMCPQASASPFNLANYISNSYCISATNPGYFNSPAACCSISGGKFGMNPYYDYTDVSGSAPTPNLVVY